MSNVTDKKLGRKILYCNNLEDCRGFYYKNE
jgi:hypothetical protein